MHEYLPSAWLKHSISKNKYRNKKLHIYENIFYFSSCAAV